MHWLRRAQADETRKKAAEEKRIAAELKKAQSDEARQRAIAKKKAQGEEVKKKARSQLNKRPADAFVQRPAKKVSMFDEFRDPPRSQPPADH